MPPSIVESDKFEKLLCALDPQYHLPTRKHLSMNLLKAKYEAVKQKVMSQVQQQSCINLTVDLWTNQIGSSFLVVSAHFISNDWDMESVMLACNRVLPGRHTTENTLARFVEIKAEFAIQHKVKHIVTDSVEKALVFLPGFDEEDQDETESEEGEDEISFTHCSIPVNHLSFESHACFTHIIQLVVKEGLRKLGSINNAALKRCSRLFTHVQKSTVAADVLQNEFIMQPLQYGTDRRWNSQLKIIRSVLKIPEDKLRDIDEAAPLMSAHDKNTLWDLMEILTPFEEATDFVQVHLSPSAGYVIPCVKGLAHHLQQIYSRFKSPFVGALRESFDKRMGYYKASNTYKLAAVLDPRFKLRWSSDEIEKSATIQLLRDATEAVLESQTAASLCIESIDSQLAQPAEKISKLNNKSLFNFMQDTGTIQESTVPSANLDEYLKAPCAPLDTNPTSFWLANRFKFPILTEVAREVLSIPSSSLPVETLFTPEHSHHLTDTRYQELMFIRCNN